VRWEVTYLPLLLVAILPGVTVVLGTSLGSSACSALGSLLLKWRRVKADYIPASVRLAEMKSRALSGEFGPPPPGDGAMGWLSDLGCHLEDGHFYAWDWLSQPAWEFEGGCHRISFQLDLPGRISRVFRRWFLPAAGISVLGPAASLYFAWRSLPVTGVRNDFVAVVALDLLLLLVLGGFTWFSSPLSKPDPSRLTLTVAADRASRDCLELLFKQGER
jgi:hypothetical protein